jgi:hypothetical protein
MWRTFAIAAFSTFGAMTFTLIPTHFWVRRRMRSAGLIIERFPSAIDDWRMWHRYRDEAPARGWPAWPYYVYMTWLLAFTFMTLSVLLRFTAFKDAPSSDYWR